jgi:hypothetical protein
MGDRRGMYQVLVGRPDGKRPLEDLGMDGRVILKWIFKKWDGETWTRLLWLRIGQALVSHNDLSGSIKCGEFLD